MIADTISTDERLADNEMLPQTQWAAVAQRLEQVD